MRPAEGRTHIRMYVYKPGSYTHLSVRLKKRFTYRVRVVVGSDCLPELNTEFSGNDDLLLSGGLKRLTMKAPGSSL